MLAARAPCYAIGIVITFYLYYALSLPALFGFKNRDEHDRIADVKNATLGFEKIYVIGFPGRTDKRDQIALSAHLSGLQIEFMDAVNGSEVPLKAIPENWRAEEDIGSLGCWRAHLNVYSKMLVSGISTALIMEDDADWDINIKAQLPNIARGVQYITQANPNPTRPNHSPYGDSWEFLTIGHCGINNHEYPVTQSPSQTTIDTTIHQRYWVTENDPTVPPPHRRDGSRKPNLSPPVLQGDQTRLVFTPYKFTCTQAYAISLRGAARVLQDQASGPKPQSIDLALSAMCKYNQFRAAAAVYPPLVGQHRPAGDGSKDSDRKEGVSHGAREKAFTQNVVYPTRTNFEELLGGEEGVVRSQYGGEEGMLDEIAVGKLEWFGESLPWGRGVVVDAEQFVHTA